MTSFAHQESGLGPLPMGQAPGDAISHIGRKRSTEEVEDILQSMLGEQSDHVFSRFSESYIKVRLETPLGCTVERPRIDPSRTSPPSPPHPLTPTPTPPLT
jgi:hypothetical protein